MQQKHAHIVTVIHRYLQGESLSVEEQRLLDDWLEASAANREVFRQVQDPAAFTEFLSIVSDQEAVDNAYSAFTAAKPAPAKVRTWRRWSWAAAALLAGVIAAGSYYFAYRNGSQTAKVVVQTPDIEAGSNKAILTLSDGTKVALDSSGNQLIRQGATAVRQLGGSLQYETKDQGQVIAYNTLATPRGGQFQLVLSDGTKVWLNAASSIRYPTAFTDGERKVRITGEVYFEVAQDASRIFRVAVNNETEITVLGTHFNVNAYDNEDNIITTLLEGSVEVTNRSAGVTLKPGQQAQVSLASGIQVINQINTERVVAWKNGLFSFENAGLAEIMRQLERWYDIEVVYETTVPDIALKGEITRDVPLDDLLKAFSKMGVRYRLEGRRLTIRH